MNYKPAVEDIQAYRLKVCKDALRELLAAIDDPKMQELESALAKAYKALALVS